MARHQPPKNDDTIVVRLPSTDKRDLLEAARRRDRTYNWLARHIIQTWLNRDRRKR